MSEPQENTSTNQYDDAAKGGYSYEEKLNLVAADAMDPHSIGLETAEDAKRIILGQDAPKQKLGDFVVFEASVVPLRLRAHWARKDLKVQPIGAAAKAWEADWCEQNKGSFSIQGRLRSGTMTAMVQQEFNDPILGFAVLLRQTADMIEAKYTELKKTDENPVETRDELFNKLGDQQIDAEEEAASKLKVVGNAEGS